MMYAFEAARGILVLLMTLAISLGIFIPQMNSPKLRYDAVSELTSTLEQLRPAQITTPEQLVELYDKHQSIKVRRGDTLQGILGRHGLEYQEVTQLVEEIKPLYNTKYIRPGDYIDVWTLANRPIAVSFKPTSDRYVVTLSQLGGWTSQEITVPTTVDVVRVKGQVRSSIYSAGVDAGAGDQQIVDFANIFAYDVDFRREIQPGDQFEILYEVHKDKHGDIVKSGAVLYASLHSDTVNKAFYRYQTDDMAEPDYFDEQGKSVRRFLMKTPVNGARLSSNFGFRKHPISGYTKLHKGTDFAAPTGTPIYAAGSGIITMIQRHGGYGNYIRIQHGNGYDTAYAHMSRYHPGLTRGSRVRQGDIIGYVGSTGASTGPHLHYEVYHNGNALDIMKLKMPEGTKLNADQLKAYRGTRQYIDRVRRLASSRPNDGINIYGQCVQTQEVSFMAALDQR